MVFWPCMKALNELWRCNVDFETTMLRPRWLSAKFYMWQLGVDTLHYARLGSFMFRLEKWPNWEDFSAVNIPCDKSSWSFPRPPRYLGKNFNDTNVTHFIPTCKPAVWVSLAAAAAKDEFLAMSYFLSWGRYLHEKRVNFFVTNASSMMTGPWAKKSLSREAREILYEPKTTDRDSSSCLPACLLLQ